MVGGGGEVSLNWKCEGIVGYLRLEFRRNGGLLDLELFPQGTDKSVSLENAHFMDLFSLQIKRELMTPLTTTEVGYKTSIHQSVTLSSACKESSVR